MCVFAAFKQDNGNHVSYDRVLIRLRCIAFLSTIKIVEITRWVWLTSGLPDVLALCKLILFCIDLVPLSSPFSLFPFYLHFLSLFFSYFSSPSFFIFFLHFRPSSLSCRWQLKMQKTYWQVFCKTAKILD